MNNILTKCYDFLIIFIYFIMRRYYVFMNKISFDLLNYTDSFFIYY